MTRAAATTRAWLTLHHDTPYSRATSEAARREPDTARSSWLRSLAVSCCRGPSCVQRSTNVRRWQRAWSQNMRRLSQRTSHGRPNGRSRIDVTRREWTRPVTVPQSGQPCTCTHSSISTRMPSGLTVMAATRNPSRSYNSDVPCSMLAALRGWVIRHQPPSKAAGPSARYDTPTKINHLSPRRAPLPIAACEPGACSRGSLTSAFLDEVSSRPTLVLPRALPERRSSPGGFRVRQTAFRRAW